VVPVASDRIAGNDRRAMPFLPASQQDLPARR
jgi:hypothetical protein